jgi:hypothetical protein
MWSNNNVTCMTINKLYISNYENLIKFVFW